MKKILSTLSLLLILPFITMAESPSDQVITGDTNYVITVAQSTNATVIARRSYRVAIEITNLSNVPVYVSIGSSITASTPVLIGLGSKYEFHPPYVYWGPIAVRASGPSTNDAVLNVYEIYRNTP